jgi:DNA-directed RNA polymerase specialized sigma24 family protein
VRTCCRRHWRTIEGNPEGYLRRTLYHLATDGWRRQRSWRQRLMLLQPPADRAAEILGCSTGTVKSSTSRGLRKLRELSEGADRDPHAGQEPAQAPAPGKEKIR